MVQLGPRLGTKKDVGLTSDKFVRFRWFQSGMKGSPRGDGPNSVDAEGAETNQKIVRVRIVQSLLRRAEDRLELEDVEGTIMDRLWINRTRCPFDVGS